MNEMPRKAVARTARLASLPLGVAGRVVGGWGKRLVGQDAAEVSAQMSAKTAEQLFAVLGQLKGGAMKFGQALSVFEAAVPDEMAAPYREALTKLQAAAPPMSTQATHRMLAEQLGRNWRARFAEFSDEPAASASIGQVHRAVWHDGRQVAVKVQYPGADEALMSDLRQLSRFSRLFQALVPGTEIKPLLAELTARMSEELDYRQEADNQRTVAAAFDGDDHFLVPKVVASAPKVLISEWVTGTPLAEIIREGDKEVRDRAGYLLAEFHYSAPARAGMLHADPHPGNFRILPNADGSPGRLGVLDYGAVARLPDRSLPPALGRLMRLAANGDPDLLLEGLRREGFVKDKIQVDPQAVLDYLAPFVEPARVDSFRFNREWMREQFERVNNPRSSSYAVTTRINLPPAYLLIHRTWLGGIGLLSQLEAEAPFRAILEESLPGFAE